MGESGGQGPVHFPPEGTSPPWVPVGGSELPGWLAARELSLSGGGPLRLCRLIATLSSACAELQAVLRATCSFCPEKPSQTKAAERFGIRVRKGWPEVTGSEGIG